MRTIEPAHGESPPKPRQLSSGSYYERDLVEDEDLPILGYSYLAVRDCLRKQGIAASVNATINRARKLDCHHPRRTEKVHDREVLTASVGALIQHDGSTYR